MVSRETLEWSLDRFLGWYGSSFETSGGGGASFLMTPESAVLFFLSRVVRGASFGVVSCCSESLSFGLYSISYNLCPDLSFYLPRKDDDPLRVPGFLTEDQRYAEEFFSVLSSSDCVGVVFSTERALGQYSFPATQNKLKSVDVRVGKNLKMRFLVHCLKRWGYVRADRVQNPLYYSVRGGMIDVFLVHSRNPVRIEFFGDEVTSIRLFNPFSQRTIKKIDSVSVLPRCLKEDTDAPSLFSMFSSKKDLFWLCSPVVTNSNKVRIKNISGVIKAADIEPYSEKVLRAMVSSKVVFKLFVFSQKPDGFTFPPFLPKSLLLGCVCGLIRSGFILKDRSVVVLGADNASGIKKDFKTRWMIGGDGARRFAGVLDISDLVWGQPIVHENFGVGEYRGLEKAGGADCIKIKYKDGGVVFVPVEGFGKIHKLVGVAKDSVKISSLGSGVWKRKQKAVKKHVVSIVGDLIKNYSQRQKPRDFEYEKSGEFYEAVCDSFSFTETDGQLSAIRDVLADMESPFPVDRLVCGDVGFGKTEVAIRASVRAVESGRAVFVLTPTTVLANQHYISFMKRFSSLGVCVELLSRFRSKGEQKKIIKRAVGGSVDILIGTHRLLSGDVRTDRLGLIIIDEEHRFGVKQKEKIKNIKPFVDVLSLTATPIPRTLKQSLVGLKRVSIIDTPPKSRRPVKTVVSFFDWRSVFSAISAEIKRGGQVYFIHNDISTLYSFANKIKNEFSSARIRVAHGQLSSRTLESVMLSFFKNEIDVLCCTTIVGSGLDVSSANTIIINNAHFFGLSQLYQLRGRVGRSPSQAYCYLLVPGGLRLNDSSFQRLKTMEQNTALGSGYKIALKDLDIRGPGDLFGEKQSGAVSSVGFHMYNKILKEAIDEARGLKKGEPSPNIIIYLSSGLPNTYVPLLEDRLYFYQSLALSDTKEKISAIENEIIDRYGPLPDETFCLIFVAKLRALLIGTSIRKVNIQKKYVELFLKSVSPFSSVENLLLRVKNSFDLIDSSVVLKSAPNDLLIVRLVGLSVARASFRRFIVSLNGLFLS